MTKVMNTPASQKGANSGVLPLCAIWTTRWPSKHGHKLPRRPTTQSYVDCRPFVRCCPDRVTDAIDSLERANWNGAQLASTTGRNCRANVFATRCLNTVPVAMPRMPPSGLLNAVILADMNASNTQGGTAALGKIFCPPSTEPKIHGRRDRLSGFRWNTLLVQETILLERFSNTPRKSSHPTSTPVQGRTRECQLECPWVCATIWTGSKRTTSKLGFLRQCRCPILRKPHAASLANDGGTSAMLKSVCVCVRVCVCVCVGECVCVC